MKCKTPSCTTIHEEGSKKLYCIPCAKERRRLNNIAYHKQVHKCQSKALPQPEVPVKVKQVCTMTEEEQIKINLECDKLTKANVILNPDNIDKILIIPQTSGIAWMFR